MWRVEQSLVDGRYYVVRGYGVGRRWAESWKNKLGAGDFTSLQDAQDQADLLNRQEAAQ